MQPKQHTIAVAIVTNEKKEILLAKRYELESPQWHNKWEFLGGGIEFGEKPEQAAVREAKEEGSIDVKIIRLLPEVVSNVWEFPNGEKQQILIISYECRIISGSPKQNIQHNTGELKFYSVDEIKKLNTLPKVYEMAKMAISNH